MNNKEFARKLEKRTRELAVQVIRLSANLPESSEGKVIRTQLTKAATSIGANYREANRGRSKADFRNKMRICEGECSETQYWLEIIADTKMLLQQRMLRDTGHLRFHHKIAQAMTTLFQIKQLQTLITLVTLVL